MIECEKCGREYVYDRKKGHRKTVCNSCHANKSGGEIARSTRLKIKMVEYKGGKCEKCGYNKCYQALDFHHLNEEEKIFALSGHHCRKWEKIEAELNKCILVCANCHREIHAGVLP